MEGLKTVLFYILGVAGLIVASIMFTGQAEVDGQYERLRAQMETDATGHYEFTTIKSGHYKVDCQFLPAHIHYRVSYLDNQPLLTSLFFEGDPYLAHIPSVKQTHIKSLTTEARPDGSALHTTFDLVLPASLGGEG